MLTAVLAWVVAGMRWIDSLTRFVGSLGFTQIRQCCPWSVGKGETFATCASYDNSASPRQTSRHEATGRCQSRGRQSRGFSRGFIPTRSLASWSTAARRSATRLVCSSSSWWESLGSIGQVWPLGFWYRSGEQGRTWECWYFARVGDPIRASGSKACGKARLGTGRHWASSDRGHAVCEGK